MEEIFFKILMISTTVSLVLLFFTIIYSNQQYKIHKHQFIIENKCIEQYLDNDKNFTFYKCNNNITIL